MNTTNTT